MNRWIAFSVAIATLLVTGLAHGLWSERWQQSEALADALARINHVPLDVGEWHGTTMEGDPADFAQAGALNYLTRTYVHAKTGTHVQVILMCGRAGRMAVHTPEVCYRGAGYDMVDDPEITTVQPADGGESGDLWTARFVKATGGANGLRLHWSWSSGGRWKAPANPRWEFRGQPFLYKLYASYEAGAPAREIADDFLPQFLSVLRQTLRPSE